MAQGISSLVFLAAWMPAMRDLLSNAAHINTLAHELLHYSPAPSVVERLIESAVLLAREEEVRFFMARYRAAYPQDYARWAPRGSAS